MAATEPTSASPDRLAYLDGLRGIAALVVVGEHALGGTGLPGKFGPLGLGWLEALAWPLTLGVPMVYLFLALSGFGLAYGELARRARGRATPLGEFVRRRAWRILPPYYAAIAVCLVAAAAGQAWARHAGGPNGFMPLTGGGLLAHLLLVHDYYQGWLTQVEPPMWSIAVEVQLYVFFPLAFAALLRWPALLVAAFPLALGWGLEQAHVALPNLALMHLVHLGPWFVGGMAAARVAHDGVPARRALLLGPALAAAAVVAVGGLRVFESVPAVQAVWGVAVIGLLLGLYHAPAAWWNVPAWPACREVGRWSYSLYLVHFPVVTLLELTLGRWVPAGAPHLLAMLAVGLPASCLVARGFYQLVERPAIARMRHPAPTANAEAAA